MPQIPDPAPALILWDLDGTLCLHNEAFRQLAPEAVAEAALDFGIPLSPAAAVDFARQNFSGQRSCVRAFASRFDLDEDKLFSRYYEHLRPDFLQIPPETLAAFRQCAGRFSHGVLTHAPTIWAVRALKKLDLLELFDPGCILTCEHLNGCHKSDAQGQIALQNQLQRIGRQPRQVALVDDNPAVLRAMRPCAETLIWINPDVPAEPSPDGLHVAPTALAALQLVLSLAAAPNSGR